MENVRTLNTTDEWEGIVNANAMHRSLARERVAARQRAKRIGKMQNSVIGMSVACIASITLGATGAVVGWLATIVAVGCLVASSVLFGRYTEAKKR